MKATSKTINATYVSMDWESLKDYNEQNDCYRCRVLFSEVNTTDENVSNKALAFLQKVTSSNVYSIVVNLDSEEYGKTEEEKTKTFEDAVKGENIPLTIVSVALEKTYYTETGIPVDMRKIAYIGTDNHEEQAIASVTRRLAKQLEDEELFESDPTKKGAEEDKRKRR